MVAPCPPCTALWAAREVGVRREGEKVEEHATCFAGEGQEGSGDSHAGKTKNNGAHGDQRGKHEQPLVQEQQPSLQPQPQSQQLFDSYAQCIHHRLDRTAQPSECRMCKKIFPSRNSMFRHLTERHQFYQENQHKSESMEEEAKKQSHRTCDELTLLSGHLQAPGYRRAKAAVLQDSASNQESRYCQMPIDLQLSAIAVRTKRKCTSDERKYENINHSFST